MGIGPSSRGITALIGWRMCSHCRGYTMTQCNYYILTDSRCCIIVLGRGITNRITHLSHVWKGIRKSLSSLFSFNKTKIWSNEPSWEKCSATASAVWWKHYFTLHRWDKASRQFLITYKPHWVVRQFYDVMKSAGSQETLGNPCVFGYSLRSYSVDLQL